MKPKTYGNAIDIPQKCVDETNFYEFSNNENPLRRKAKLNYMNTLRIISIFTFLFLCTNCICQVEVTWELSENSTPKKEKIPRFSYRSVRYFDAIEFARHCIELYDQDNNLNHLEKGITKLKRVINISKDTAYIDELGYYLLRFYSFTQEYDAAIEIAKKYEYAFKTFYPYGKSVYYDRFCAIKYHVQNDTVMRNRHIRSMLDSIHPFIDAHQLELDSMCRDCTIIDTEFWPKVVRQYYYYMYVIDPQYTSSILRKKNYCKKSFEDYYDNLGDFSRFIVY